MLIGIDASRAFVAAPTGTEVYSLDIITALLRDSSAYRFRLYTRNVPPSGLYLPMGNVELRTIPFPRLWTHLRLSAEIVAHSPDALFVPSHVLPIAHPRRSIVTVHDLGYLHFPQAHRALDRLYLDLSTRWNVRAAMCVIADSNATRQDLIQFYRVNPDKVRIIYPGLREEFVHNTPDPSRIEEMKRRYGITGDYIVAVGTVHPRKNYERLIQAFQALAQEYQLVIVGKKGWHSGQIIATVEKLQLSARVRLLDYVPIPDLTCLYSGARICVFASLYEGFGFPVLEAQACGTPVVCSNTSSLPEVAGDSAEYFDPLDLQAISESMKRVLRDEARRVELIARGAANQRRFGWERAAHEILEAITSG